MLATSAFPPLVRSIRRYVVPVYDYVLVTEPLSAEQRAAVGWKNRQGAADSGNQFHYYRLTSDDRILWGGYDAVYNFPQRPGAASRPAAGDLRDARPELLRDLPAAGGNPRFTHRWGGAIDTCSRFCMTFGKALGGRAVYVVGFTGLGVGASRFGARAALDLADGVDSELTRLRLVRTKPCRSRPSRSAGPASTDPEGARPRRPDGQARPLAQALDRMGLGFDS